MVTTEEIDRINVLARKSKSVGLTEAEKAEQHELRQKYVQSFKTNLKSHLDNIRFIDDLEEKKDSN